MPATCVPAETIMDALEVACRAPSLHNSQPWRGSPTTTASTCTPTPDGWFVRQTAAVGKP